MCPPTDYNLSRGFAGRVSRCAQDLLSLLQAELEEWKQRLCKIAGLCAAQADFDIPPGYHVNWGNHEIRCERSDRYRLDLHPADHRDHVGGHWRLVKVFNLSHSWRDTVVVTLTMLPGMGLVLLGDKLRKIAASNELAEKLREMWGLPR